jgi:hypothetical protein
MFDTRQVSHNLQRGIMKAQTVCMAILDAECRIQFHNIRFCSLNGGAS